MMNKKTILTIFHVALFSIAMGYLETAVVVYMRALYYPEGFAFPLKAMQESIIMTEFFRELATIIMLAGIGIISGRSNIERFAYFIFSFAVWDIFYYVFLKILLNWPESLVSWDILFFIPVVWVGPVIAPVINSLTMIILAVIIIYFTDKTLRIDNGELRKKNERKNNIKTGKLVWTLLITGSLVTIISYIYDYTGFMLERMSLMELLVSTNAKETIKYTSEYIPHSFNWIIFGLGELIILAAIVIIYRQNKIYHC